MRGLLLLAVHVLAQRQVRRFAGLVNSLACALGGAVRNLRRDPDSLGLDKRHSVTTKKDQIVSPPQKPSQIRHSPSKTMTCAGPGTKRPFLRAIEEGGTARTPAS